MKKSLRGLALCAPLWLAGCGAGSIPGNIDAPAARADAQPGLVRAGVGVADLTPPVGFCAGQYCSAIYEEPGKLIGDPFFSSHLKTRSYGVQSRLDTRAIVVEGSNGQRVALVKIDNYLAQDMLMRRVAQILAQGSSGIRYEQIFNHATHNHSAAYYSTLAAGVWLFEDMFDLRMFEYQARQIASAIESAAANLKPARMGATTIQHRIYKGNVVRQAAADDGTPAGYPVEYNDHGLVVMRFDDLSDPAQPKPLAAWINWGEHPESLDGYNLHSADYLAPLQRFVDAEIGAPMVFSQGDVGSSENTGNACEILDEHGKVIRDTTTGYGDNGSPQCGENAPDEGVLRDWNHKGYVQTERNVRYLADDIVRAWNAIGAGQGDVPMSSDFVVDSRIAWVPGPVSHPYPSVSNCRTERTLDGDVGVPVAGLPDCSREAGAAQPVLSPALAPLALVVETLKAHGFGVLPDNYDGPSAQVVEESLRIKLQAVRLGEVLIASCACEAQNDLILNLESRADNVAGNIYDGFDWACLIPEFQNDAQYASACEIQKRYYDPALQKAPVTGSNFEPAAIAHMRAQVHNDAVGWDAAGYALQANSESADLATLKGNFTKEELTPERGYALPVGVGHAGDYNGYTVSYREYQSRDTYRKALTAYGPHTADYMVTRLVRMAGAMKGGPELGAEPLDTLATVDELKQQALALSVGRATAAAFDAYQALLPNDAGPAAAVTQPQAIEHFNAATFTWRGGNTQVDNPQVRVERQAADGQWQPYAGQTGEVQTLVQFPQGVPGTLRTYAGTQEWLWTANFEAYAAFPKRLGSVPFGTYRFVVDGAIRLGRSNTPYHLESDPFTVSPWSGIAVNNIRRDAGSVSFEVPPVAYPASYASAFPFIDASQAEERICNQCSFRPWARAGRVVSAAVEVTRAKGNVETIAATQNGTRWSAPLTLATGDVAIVRVLDDNGETSAVQVP